MPTPVRFLFDYASPWAFLANELVPERLAGCEIVYEPVYLRGFESFASGIPFTRAKMLYLARDLARCAEHHGIVTQPPAVFPVNGLYALRGALAAQELGCFDRYHTGMFRAVWTGSADVSSAAGVLDVVAKLDLDGAAFAERMGAPDLKQRLVDQTAAAAEADVFGVPSFLVGDELFWGHDRLDYVRRAAAQAEA